MFCERPATVHLTDIVDGKKREAHLCDRCARDRGLVPAGAGPQLDLSALLGLLGAARPAAPADAACPACGLSYGAFKAAGRFGCPHDYDAFRAALDPLLERVHRATAHAGKVPAAARAAEADTLRGRLRDAVAAEDYEEAARLRDRIRALGARAEGTTG
jgi:protein arginine kinase activator